MKTAVQALLGFLEVYLERIAKAHYHTDQDLHHLANLKKAMDEVRGILDTVVDEADKVVDAAEQSGTPPAGIPPVPGVPQ